MQKTWESGMTDEDLKKLAEMLRKGGSSATDAFLSGARIKFEREGLPGLHKWIEGMFFEMPQLDQAALIGTFMIPYFESKTSTKH